jgi:RNA polymerase sigma-70 factor (ECF subfamily)
VARYTGGRDTDDIVQETWLRVARAAPRFDPRRRFTTWCFQIAVNLCHDWFRRTQRAPEPTSDPQGVAASHTTRVDAGLDAAGLLAALPEKQRAVLLLRFYQDLSEAEIAEILDVPPGTVKSRMHGAMARLRALVEKPDDV